MTSNMDRLKKRIAETIPEDEIIEAYSQLRAIIPQAIIGYIENTTAWLQDRIYENGRHDIFLHWFSEEEGHQHVLLGRGSDEKSAVEATVANIKNSDSK